MFCKKKKKLEAAVNHQKEVNQSLLHTLTQTENQVKNLVRTLDEIEELIDSVGNVRCNAITKVKTIFNSVDYEVLRKEIANSYYGYGLIAKFEIEK